VAAGNGNFALAAAREGASVVASDLSPVMVELGRARSAAEGHEIEWVVADAEELPFEDGRFDCAASVFGAMFAPRPERVAGELFRVVRPGGTVGMASWVPAGPFAEMLEVRRKYGPELPEDMPNPADWGKEEVVSERFDGLAARIEAEVRAVTFRWGSPEEAWDFLDRVAPTQQADREALSSDEYAALRLAVLEVFRRYTDASGALVFDSPYLLVVARKRG
jgi:SAM-dependent methyltransferase